MPGRMRTRWSVPRRRGPCRPWLPWPGREADGEEQLDGSVGEAGALVDTSPARASKTLRLPWPGRQG
eukprot:365962-Chlamydomonas_euryale.AAC.4